MRKADLNSVLKSYSKKMDKREQFSHVLGEIRKHIPKLKKLKKKEDKPGHLKEEVCDVYILGSLLVELEKINKRNMDKASKHFAEKVKEIYGK